MSDEVLDGWENGQDSSLTDSELQSDLSDLGVGLLEGSTSSIAYTLELQQDYNLGHFQDFNDFVGLGFTGVSLGFGLALVLSLVNLAFNALLNIIKKGGN